MEIVKQMLDKIEIFYPQSHTHLQELYSEALPNIPFYQFNIVARFCRCNFGEIDNVKDIDNHTFNLEHVKCPLRGMFKEENVICHPVNSKI